jgi:hypothetical protein
LDPVEEASRKRGLPVEPTDGLDNAKRPRLGVDTPPLIKVPPLPSGSTSYAQLFTLTEDVGLSSFDVKQLPADLIVRIAVPILARVDQNTLSQAIEVGFLFSFFLSLGGVFLLITDRPFILGIKPSMKPKLHRRQYRKKTMTMSPNTSPLTSVITLTSEPRLSLLMSRNFSPT